MRAQLSSSNFLSDFPFWTDEIAEPRPVMNISADNKSRRLWNLWDQTFDPQWSAVHILNRVENICWLEGGLGFLTKDWHGINDAVL